MVRGLPLVGNLPRILKGGLDFLLEARAKHGDIYTLDLGLTKVIALNHPRHAHRVLREYTQNYTKGGFLWDSAREILGNGLPVSDGDFWRRQRRMIQPHFHRERLAALTEVMVQTIDEGLAAWEAHAASGQPMDVAHAMTRITMSVIVKTMFGTGLSHAEADAVGEHMRYILDYTMNAIVTHALPAWLPIPGARRFREAIQEVDRVVFGIIERRRREGGGSADLISMLLDMEDADTGDHMTGQQVRDEAVSMFLAGYETTAVSMAWLFELLLRRPERTRELEEELDSVLGGRTPGFADVRALPRTLNSVKEALRLYPPAFWLTRTAVEEDEIDGFRIPAGALVAPMMYVIHRHPDFWEAPEQFDPGRFTPERSAKRDPLAWLPFGAGQRLCVGKEFALMEGQLILARVLQRYRLEPVAGRVARPRLAATLRQQDGVWMTLARRAPPAMAGG